MRVKLRLTGWILLAVLLAAPTVRAQQAGTFARMGFGARGMALGNALAADLSGAAAPYYNPALAPYADRPYISSSYGFLSFDRSLQYIQFTTPLEPRAGLSVGLIHAGVSKIDGRDASGYHTRMYSSNEYALTVAFGLKVSQRLSGGLGLRLYRARLSEEVEPATSLGLNAGLTARITDRLFLGAAVDDLLAEYRWDTGPAYGNEGRQTTDPFPLRMRLGGSYELLEEQLRLLAEYEARIVRMEKRSRRVEPVGGQPSVTVITDWVRRYTSRLHLGGEWHLVESFAVRAGVSQIQKNRWRAFTPSAGFALSEQLGSVSGRLDYTAVLEPYRTGLRHLIGLHVDL